MTPRSSFVRRLQLGLGLLVAITLAGLSGILTTERRVASALDRSHASLSLLDDFKEVQIRLSSVRSAEQEFVRQDLHAPQLFEMGSSPTLELHAAALAELDALLARLVDQPEAQALGALEIREAVGAYEAGFAEMVALYRERGWNYLGLIGTMGEASFEFIDRLGEGPDATTLRADVLELLRDRDKYLRDLDTQAGFMVGERLAILHEDVDARRVAEAAALHADLDRFAAPWTRLGEIDDRIGRSAGAGLRGELAAAQGKVVPLTIAAVEQTRTDFEASRTELAEATATARAVSSGAVLLVVVVAVLLAVSLGARLRHSLATVLDAVEAYAAGDRSARVGKLVHEDEFAVVGGAFDLLAENLNDTTEELEEINASLKLAVKGDTAGLLDRIQGLIAERPPRAS